MAAKKRRYLPQPEDFPATMPWWQRLGLAVLAQAIRDYPRSRAFLVTDNPDRTFWCAVAGVNPLTLVEAARGLDKEERHGNLA